MRPSHPPKLDPATADDVLAILREDHWHQCAYDPEADAGVTLTHDTTIAEWRLACDLVGWRRVARALNAEWDVDIPLDDWYRVLEPEKQRRLGGVCALLAEHVRVARIEMAGYLGAHCMSTGAFRAVRSYLAEAGADVNVIRPSTPLREYTRRYPDVFIGPIARLAPGTLPRFVVRAPVRRALICSVPLSLLMLVLGAATDKPQVIAAGAIGIIVFLLGGWMAARWVLPASVDFPGLVTFGDLARQLANGSDRNTEESPLTPRGGGDSSVARGG